MASAELTLPSPPAAAHVATPGLLAHVRDRAGDYFPGMAGAEVRLLAEHRRPQTLLLRCELALGAERRRVVVKLPLGAGPAAGLAEERPRVAPLPDPEQKFRMEYLALTSLERHLAAAGDARFRSVRMLDLLPETGATVMEEAPGSSLRKLMTRATRLHPSRNARALNEHFRTAGAWLAQFQSLPPHELCRDRGESRESFGATIAAAVEYLERRKEAQWLRGAERALLKAAQSVLPERLPLASAHGDFAPRNVLVDGAGTLAVLDTLARFRAPLYEDLGYFIVDLRTARPQTWTLGWAYSSQSQRVWESALVEGWAPDGSADRRMVTLFCAQALLDRWCARTASDAEGGRLRSVEHRAARLHFSRYLRHLCAELQ